MLDSKLILIEGFPGAGKTTTTVKLGTHLQKQGFTCNWHLEEDDPHPIACLGFKLSDLAQKLPPLWATFAEQARQKPTITIIESRLWQNTAMFMFMNEHSTDEIVDVCRLVHQEIAPLKPILLNFRQDNVEIALKRTRALRGEEWMEWALEKTTANYRWFQSRGLNNFEGWIQFFEEWQGVKDRLYHDWPFSKMTISNPHDDWDVAYQQLYRFLQV